MLELWSVRCCRGDSSECSFVESFKGVPPVLDDFPVWWGALGPGNPHDGRWVFLLWVVLKVVEGHSVLVDVDEGLWG